MAVHEESARTISSCTVPTFFRACCAEASEGGPIGFRIPGYAFARHLTTSPECDNLEHYDLVVELHTVLETKDPDAIWAWVVRAFPAFAMLVPSDRHAAFVRGIQEAITDGD